MALHEIVATQSGGLWSCRRGLFLSTALASCLVAFGSGVARADYSIYGDWKSQANGDLWIGILGTASMEASRGENVVSRDVLIGVGTGSVGTALIDASTWTVGIMQVGSEGFGTLEIRNGGVVRSDGIMIGNGHRAEPGLSSSGLVLVSGANSRLEAVGILVSSAGNGTLTIEKDGLADIEEGTVTAVHTSLGVGVINLLGSASAGRGVLQARNIQAGAGQAT